MPSIIEPNSTLSQLDRQPHELTREHGHVPRLDEFRHHLDEHEQALTARHVPPPPPPRAQPDPKAAGEADRMRQLQTEIARRLECGDTLDTVERELIAPSELAEEQRSALWLYAWSHPKRPALSQRQPRLSVWAALGNALPTLIGIDRYLKPAGTAAKADSARNLHQPRTLTNRPEEDQELCDHRTRARPD